MRDVADLTALSDRVLDEFRQRQVELRERADVIGWDDQLRRLDTQLERMVLSTRAVLDNLVAKAASGAVPRSVVRQRMEGMFLLAQVEALGNHAAELRARPFFAVDGTELNPRTQLVVGALNRGAFANGSLQRDPVNRRPLLCRIFGRTGR